MQTFFTDVDSTACEDSENDQRESTPKIKHKCAEMNIPKLLPLPAATEVAASSSVVSPVLADISRADVRPFDDSFSMPEDHPQIIEKGDKFTFIPESSMASIHTLRNHVTRSLGLDVNSLEGEHLISNSIRVSNILSCTISLI